eukprot:g6109.t1
MKCAETVHEARVHDLMLVGKNAMQLMSRRHSKLLRKLRLNNINDNVTMKVNIKNTISTEGEILPFLERKRNDAIFRGVAYLRRVTTKEKLKPVQASNMLFLIHKLWQIAYSSAPTMKKLHNELEDICWNLAKTWTGMYESFATSFGNETTRDLVQRALETLHICKRLGIYGEKNGKSKNSIPFQSQSLTKDNNKTKQSENDDSNSRQDESSKPRSQRSAAKRSAEAISRLAKCNAHSDDANGKSNKRRKLDNLPNELGLSRSSEKFSFERLKDDLVTILQSSVSLDEMLGMKISTLPVTPSDFCGHCGHDSNKRSFVTSERRRCNKCNLILRSATDYGALTDAAVWTYICEDIGIRMIFQDEEIGFNDFLVLLPEARHYRWLDELGTNNFKLQSYFITHFIYVMSDWGAHQLPRNQYKPEFDIMVSTLSLCITALEDAEIVGEFLHCLRILGVSEETDPHLTPLMNGAMAWLIEFEDHRNRRDGCWVKKQGTNSYDQYHSAYCGIVGLLVKNPKPPHDRRDEPKAQRVLHKYRGLGGNPTSIPRKEGCNKTVSVNSSNYVSPINL